MKLIFLLQKNTLEKSSLLTITLKALNSILNKNQLKQIVDSLFVSIENFLNENFYLSKNIESIVVENNIKNVFDFIVQWKILIDQRIIKNLKSHGNLNQIGTIIQFQYLSNIPLTGEILEINKEESEDFEWNYKFRIYFENGRKDLINLIFVSCRNCTQTFVSFENETNKQLSNEELNEMSKRKLQILRYLKNYVESK